jgi:hypothetical protein
MVVPILLFVKPFLYISHLSFHAEVFPSVMVDITPPKCKWVKIPSSSFVDSRASSSAGSASTTRGRGGGRGRGRGSQQVGGGSGGGSSSRHHHHEVDWFLSLPDLCLSSLELGKFLHKSSSSMIFSHKSNEHVVIKMYEFSESFETLSQFKKEIDTYIFLVDLHGILVPHIHGYGASWGHFLGFIVMEALGESLEEAEIEKHFIDILMDGINIHHQRRVFHGDLQLKNIVFAINENDTSAHSFGFRFIDFGESIYPCDDSWLHKEKEAFLHLLQRD